MKFNSCIQCPLCSKLFRISRLEQRVKYMQAESSCSTLLNNRAVLPYLTSTMKHNADNVRLFMDQEPSFQVAKFVYECMEFRRSEECED